MLAMANLEINAIIVIIAVTRGKVAASAASVGAGARRLDRGEPPICHQFRVPNPAPREVNRACGVRPVPA
jgi:hypothetical protein